jgi:hypothetical protein
LLSLSLVNIVSFSPLQSPWSSVTQGPFTAPVKTDGQEMVCKFNHNVGMNILELEGTRLAPVCSYEVELRFVQTKGEGIRQILYSHLYKVQGICELVYEWHKQANRCLMVARQYLNQRYEEGMYKKKRGRSSVKQQL